MQGPLTGRRDFIKFVVSGSVSAGCPLLQAAPAAASPAIDGDHFEICHALRDGHKFPTPPASARHEIAIAGGGISGLTAAYLLRDRDFTLLEKEPHWGGNAYLNEYEGQAYATGAAFTERGDEADQFAKEIGLEALPIDNPDGAFLNGQFIPDVWRSGLDHLPYPAKVLRNFRNFRRAMLAIDVKRTGNELDTVPFSRMLQGYAREIRAWFDGYGLSTWGGITADTSALVAVGDFQESAADGAKDERVTFPGGLGAIGRRLSEMLLKSHGDRMHASATIVGMAQERDRVAVTYVQGAEVKCLEAKAVIIAAPKFIARRLVAGLPDAQNKAMASIRYAPYAVVNLIFDRPVFNRGYDNWCPGSAFTDFIVADWVIRNQPGYRQRNNILTCYTPLREAGRAQLLTEDGCRNLARNVLRDFLKLFPESNASPVEVHLYRRGHPMFIPAPGTYTKIIPVTRHPMERIFFANTDSEGPISSTVGGIAAARRAVEETKGIFGKGTAAATHA